MMNVTYTKLVLKYFKTSCFYKKNFMIVGSVFHALQSISFVVARIEAKQKYSNGREWEKVANNLLLNFSRKLGLFKQSFLILQRIQRFVTQFAVRQP